MTDKQPRHPQIAALTEAARRALTAFQEQPAPLQDLVDAMAHLDHVVSRTAGRPRMMHIADTVAEMQAQGRTVMEIVEATGASERTVRRYYSKKEQ